MTASVTPLTRISEALRDLPSWLAGLDDTSLGDGLIGIREMLDRGEAVFAEGLRRFDRSGEYKADGAVTLVDWLRGR